MSARRANDEKKHTGPSFMPSSALSNILDTQSKPSFEEDDSQHEDDPRQPEGPNTHPDPSKEEETPPKMSIEGTNMGRLEGPNTDTGSGTDNDLTSALETANAGQSDGSKGNPGSSNKSLDDVSQNLRNAVEEVSDEAVSHSRLVHEGEDLDKIKERLALQKAQDESRKQVFGKVLDEIKKSQIGSGLTEGDISQFSQEIESHGDAIMDAIAAKIINAMEKDASTSLDREKEMAKRRAQRRVKQNASYYELLGIAPTADKAEVSRARKQLMFSLHPDRNQHDRATFEELFKGAFQIPSIPR